MIERLAYLPFGGVDRAASSFGGQNPAARYQYTGQRAEERGGLLQFNARHYDPALKRFIQPDWLAAAAGGIRASDPFAYVSNSPMNRVDPSGLDDCMGKECEYTGGGGFGGLLGGLFGWLTEELTDSGGGGGGGGSVSVTSVPPGPAPELAPVPISAPPGTAGRVVRGIVYFIGGTGVGFGLGMMPLGPFAWDYVVLPHYRDKPDAFVFEYGRATGLSIAAIHNAFMFAASGTGTLLSIPAGGGGLGVGTGTLSAATLGYAALSIQDTVAAVQSFDRATTMMREDRGGGGGGRDRGQTAKPEGTDNPFKKMRPDPEDPDSVIYKDKHTGKDIRKPKPPGFDEWWEERHR